MGRPRKFFPDYPRKAHACGRAVICVDGVDIYLTGPFGSPESRDDYERRRVERYIAHGLKPEGIHLPPQLPPKNLTVGGVIERYLVVVARQYVRDGKPTTQQTLIRSAMAALNDWCGGQPVAALTAGKLEGLRDRLAAPTRCSRCGGSGQRKKNICRACRGSGEFRFSRIYINHLLGCIKQAWDWAERHELVGPHSLRKVKGIRKGSSGVKDNPPVRLVPLDRVKATCKELDKVTADCVMVQYLACMRPGETLALRPGEIRTDGVIPDVGQFPGVWVWDSPDESNKNAWRLQARAVFFGPRAQKILRRYLDAGGGVYVFEVSRRSQPTLITYRRRIYERSIRRACVRAGIELWHPMQVRHLRASEIRSKYGSDAARMCLGHHLPGAVGRYAETDLERVAEIMAEIG